MFRRFGWRGWALWAAALALLGEGRQAASGAQGGAGGGGKVAAGTVQEIEKRIDAELSSLEALYKQLHAHPELAFEEVKTAARLAKELKALGFDVTTGVGGHGVVGVLRNGSG